MRFEVSEKAANAALRLAAMERSDKRSSALDEALEPLMRLARTMPNADRLAFQMYVQNRLADAWYYARKAKS